ncbi:hypothetical protein ACWGH8_34910 [Nonomuraea muscovyensis]
MLRDDGVLIWADQLGADGPLFLDTITVIAASNVGEPSGLGLPSLAVPMQTVRLLLKGGRARSAFVPAARPRWCPGDCDAAAAEDPGQTSDNLPTLGALSVGALFTPVTAPPGSVSREAVQAVVQVSVHRCAAREGSCARTTRPRGRLRNMSPS